MRSIELAAEELNPLIPHTAEIIVGFIAFSLLYMVLRRAVVPRFEKAFAERTDAIQGGMERAEKAQLEAEAALKQYKAQLQDARGEAASIREEARAQGAAIIEEMRVKAQEEATRIAASAKLLSSQSVKQRLPHFVMKWELLQRSWHQRLSEKHLMTRSASQELWIVS